MAPAPTTTPKKPAKSTKPAITSIDDLLLPRSLVTRLAKSVLPPNAAIQKQAVEALSQSSSVFVNFLCSAANENARGEGRKGISAADVLRALVELEFDGFVPRLEAELNLFARAEAVKKGVKGKGGEQVEAEPSVMREGGEGNPVAPMSKKPRVAAPPVVPEPAKDLDSDSDGDDGEAEDTLTTDDEAVVSDDEVEDDRVEPEPTSDTELGGREVVDEEDDALDDGAISD